MATQNQNPSRLACLVVFWAIAGAAGAIGVLPYTMALNPSLASRIPVALPIFALGQFAQTAVVLALLSWLGLRLGRTLGLGSPVLSALMYRTPDSPRSQRTLATAALVGGVAGLALLMLDRGMQPFMPATALPALASIDLWKRILACFYGGITEELLCRLFLMTTLVWICRKAASRGEGPPAAWMFWTGIIGAAFLFGLGHLPTAAMVWPLTPLVVARTLLLNAAAGIVFGWLYWRRGLEHAVVAHFSTDIMLHVIVG